jgi:hypothetical protein
MPTLLLTRPELSVLLGMHNIRESLGVLHWHEHGQPVTLPQLRLSVWRERLSVPSHSNDQGGRRPLNIHDPLSCGWLVARELKVDDPITAQPVQERVHVLLRPSITHGCLSALLRHATDAWSR